jgi:hypothetical protein
MILDAFDFHYASSPCRQSDMPRQTIIDAMHHATIFDYQP